MTDAPTGTPTTRGGHDYFKTRVNNGINTKSLTPVFFPQTSIKKGKWSYILDKSKVVFFDEKQQAQNACHDMENRNAAMLAAREVQS